MTVRVRFAPSPTGFLHVGGARTALFNWLWARHNKGTMILRIEDTDLERNKEAAVDQILDSMKWLGMDWDEGPFFQSQRFDIYREHLQRLIDAGWAYPAFETPEELDAMRQDALKQGRAASYTGAARNLTPEQIDAFHAEGRPFVWRFKVPDGVTEIPETLLGGESTKVNNADLGDFTLTRAGTKDEWGAPLYNFCCAVDDADMHISHVIRGSDHLTNTARQMLILQALGFKVPTYTHLPLIMKNNKKMSKRDADADPRFPVSVSARRDLGYLPEATVNFIALLGWAFDDKTEFFTRAELIEKFSLDGLSKSNANFDEDKYLHMNAWYLRNMAVEELVPLVKQALARAGYDAGCKDPEWFRSVIVPVAERCRLLTDFPEALSYFFEPPAAYDAKGVKKFFTNPDAAENLNRVAQVVAACDLSDPEDLEKRLRALAEEQGVGFGKVAQPIRLALTGRTASPGLFEVITGLGKEETERRLATAAERLSKGEIAEA